MAAKNALTVAVFNAAGGGNKAGADHFKEWYDELGCDIALVSEVFRFARVLRECGHLSMGSGGHGPEDVGVITRRRPLHAKTTQVTKFIDRGHADKPLLWHDRWVERVVAGVLPQRRTVAISSHAPAVIQDPHTGQLFDNGGGREWRTRGLPATETILRRDMDRNRPLIHGGDLNQHKADGGDNPAAMYDRLGMNYRTDALMWFAWNPKRFKLRSAEWLPTPPGSDGHKTGLFTLERI